MRFVLTGRCTVQGSFIERDGLTQNLSDIGDRVVDSFNQGADVLVASRTDTQKAVQARALGKPVWTYDQLFRYWSLRKDGQGEIAAREAIRGSVLPREPVAARVPVTPQGRYAMTAREAIRARLEQNARELRAAQEAPKTVAPHPSAHPLSNGRRAIDL